MCIRDRCFIQKQLDALEQGFESKGAPISIGDSSLYLFCCFPIGVKLASQINKVIEFLKGIDANLDVLSFSS